MHSCSSKSLIAKMAGVVLKALLVCLKISQCHALPKYLPSILNDINTTICNLKYRKGFLILVSEKGKKEIIKKRQVDYFLFPFGSLILKVEFGYAFLIMIVKLTWKQLFSFYGN